MGIIVALLFLALIPATIAHTKGRSFGKWYLYGAVLWIVALIHSICMPTDIHAMEQRRLQEGESRKCPFCAEVIKQEAIVCKHCGRDVPQEREPAAVLEPADYVPAPPIAVGSAADMRMMTVVVLTVVLLGGGMLGFLAWSGRHDATQTDQQAQAESTAHLKPTGEWYTDKDGFRRWRDNATARPEQ